MRLVISHRSSLETCSRIAASGKKIARPCKLRSLRDCVSAQQDLASFELESLSIDPAKPLDVLVPGAEKHCATKRLRRHVWSGSLPDGSFYQVAPGVYCTSPEFSLLLLSKSLPFNELIGLCSEACGWYAKDGSERGFYDRPPLTRVDKISAFLAKVGPASGTSKLARALRYVVENSRSPMETAVGMLVGMPVRLGGYGFSPLQLNYRIDLDDEAARMAGRRHVMLDFYFEGARVAVEYDSNQQHTGADRIAGDSRRNNTLRHLGITVINLTWAQVRDSRAFEDVMVQLAHALGRPLRTASPAGRANRVQLRADVLPSGR